MLWLRPSLPLLRRRTDPMAYDPDMGGDTALLLALAQGMFSGHVRRDVVVVDRPAV